MTHGFIRMRQKHLKMQKQLKEDAIGNEAIWL